MLLRAKQNDKILVNPILNSRNTLFTRTSRPSSLSPNATRRPSRLTSSSSRVWNSWKWLNFLPNSTHTPSLDDRVQALQDAISRRDARRTEQMYNALLEHIISEPSMGSRATRHAPGLSPDLLYNTTRVLIRNPFSKATFKPHLYNPSRRVLLSKKIYKDMKAIFGLTPLEQHTILIFRAYTIENPQAALKWLSEEGGITPHTSHFETTMRGFAYKHDMKGMKELIWNIKNTGGCITSPTSS